MASPTTLRLAFTPKTESAAPAAAPAPLPSADPWRRLMGFVYESIILFGVIWFAGYVFSSLTQFQAQRGNVTQLLMFRVFMFGVLGVYFSWFWAKGRRTVPMKTLSLDIVDRLDQPITLGRAVLRYAAGLALFLAAMACAVYIHLSLVLLNLLPFLVCFIDRQHRSLPDLIAGTRLVFSPVEGKRVRGLV